MKIVTPPQINGIDELLDLIINPGKMAHLMQQLKEMKDAVAASCDVYNTKSQADDYLAQAQASIGQAKSTLADAALIKQKAQEFQDQTKAEAAGYRIRQNQMEKDYDAKQKDLKFLEHALDERGRLLAQRSGDLDARELALTEATAALVRKQAMLDAEVKKMSDRIAAFHAVN